MASRAAKAAEQIAKDAEKQEGERTASNGATLKAVPDGTAPAPGITKGDAARAAIVAQLPGYQQDEYRKLTGEGTRHVTALAAARKVPDPAAATPADDAAAQAAALFAAFAAAPGGAAAPPVTVGAATGKPVPEPGPKPAPPAVQPGPKPPPPVVQPGPKPAPPKVRPAPKPAAARPAPAPGSCDRYIGTITATDLAGTETVFDCEHGVRNGHQTVESAETCAKRLLRNHPTGTPGTRLHPVKRDLNGRRLS